jgi:hypothetical protein
MEMAWQHNCIRLITLNSIIHVKYLQVMDVRKEDFPVVLQAYEIFDHKELFIAEQVVNNQTEVDTFTARYSGKLIKAKQWTDKNNNRPQTVTRKSGTSATTIILIIVVILVILVAIGFATGWIQQHFNIHT